METKKFIGFESTPNSQTWKQCIAIAQNQFHKSFGAEVEVNADTFVTNTTRIDGEDEVKACIGYKFYSKEKPLFIEQYFEESLVNIVEKISGKRFLASDMCEVGSMASTGRRDGIELLTQLPVFTNFLKKKVGFVTITRQVQFILNQIKLPYWKVCDADPSKISNVSRWGSYYDTKPICAFIITNEALSKTTKREMSFNQLELS
tara:strand:+ start:1052 stop:1663 length:612 start_codon:yes stop_codon:yes gene_type:complete